MSDTLLTMGDLEAFATHRSITLIRAKHLAKELKLEKEFEYFNNYNKAAGLYYHNRYHSCWMMSKVDRLAEAYVTSLESKTALVLAAMFHDFNHSGGIVSDEINIDNALKGLNVACYDAFTKHEIRDHAMRLIRVTEFPFVHKPETIEEKIIRDADILQGCTDHYQKTIYIDLYMELLVKNPGMTLIEYRKGQQKFLEGAEMFTEIGDLEKQEFLNSHAKYFWREFDKWAT